jgi:hypothetical protein
MKPIPQEWIRDYVDKMLLLAARLPEGSPMRAAAALRAEHIMDMVQAWQERAEL